MFTVFVVELNSSMLSLGGGRSVRDRTSLMTTGANGGTAGSAIAGEPSSAPLGRQFAAEFQASGSASSFTTTRENPTPSVTGYQSSS